MSDHPLTWNWLESTANLQAESFGIDVTSIKGEDFAEYAIWNTLAAIDELTEFLGEVKWKPWVSSGRGSANRDAAVGELIDVSHFIANLAVALGCTDDEWVLRYQEKQEINRQRQRDGYTGLNKCSQCKRALDDPSVSCTSTVCENE